MATRTGAPVATRFTVLLIVAVSLTSCAHRQEQAYQEALAAYAHGYLGQAAEAAHRGVEREHDSKDPALLWRFRLLEAESLAALSRYAEAAWLLRDPVPAGLEGNQLEVRRLVDLADLRKPSEAAPLLHTAQQLVTGPELVIRVHLGQGSMANNEGEFQKADASFRQALQLANQQANSYWPALALKNLALSSRKRSRYEESIEFGTQALAIAEKLGYRRIAAQARNNLISGYRYLGDFDSALSHGKQAIEYFTSVGARRDLMTCLGEMALVYDATDSHKAIEYHKHAFEIAHELNPEGGDAARLAENLATALIRVNQWDDAALWNQRATDLAKGNKDEIQFLQRNQAWIENGRGNPAKATEICEAILHSESTDPVIRWAVYDFLGEIYVKQNRVREANQAFENALKLIEESRSEIAGPNYRITLLSRLIPFFRERVDFLASQPDKAAVLRAVESSRARVLSERLGRASTPQKLPDTAGLLQLAKSSKSYILSFWVAPKRSFAWLITGKGIQQFPLPPSADLEKLVTAYSRVVEHSAQNPLTTRDAAGSVLWTQLMADIAQQIPKDGRVIVIPDGPLHRLNLETLVVPSDKPHYWIEDAEVAVAPSITMIMAKPPAPVRDGKSVLLIGAPEYAGTSYEPLKGAEREIKDIQSWYPGGRTELRVGVDATPQSYRDSHPDQFQLIHLAAHAEANGDRPLESAVVLSRHNDQYKLYARDVIGIPIRADVVTLSACHSAGARTYAGEGLMGFAWAFLQAGAHAVVAGLWAASDESTEPLMDRFYAGISAGQDPIKALRHAKRVLLTGDQQFQKPFYWAPFQIYLGFASQ